MNSTDKWIPGFEDVYKVSKEGFVTSIPRPGSKRGFIKSFKSKRGYHKCYLYKNSVKKEFNLHRLVAMTYLPNPLNLKEVNHIDGNKSNNSVSNLEWIDHRNNVKHAVKLGLIKPPSRLRIKPETIAEIRSLLKTNLNQTEIAKFFGLHKSTISLIKNNKIKYWSSR